MASVLPGLNALSCLSEVDIENHPRYIQAEQRDYPTCKEDDYREEEQLAADEEGKAIVA